MKRLALAALLGASLSLPLLFAIGAGADQTASKTVTCQEKLPKGSKRPTVKEKFPGEAVAGYQALLELEIRHGKGETPLPSGFRVVPGSDTDKHLAEAGFLAAETDAGATSSMKTETDGEEAVTTVVLPFVIAPQKSGKRSLTLPQLPLAIGRANGEQMTICTQMHLVVASDPTAEEEDPKPRPNPDPRPQFEDWPLIKWLLAAAILLLIVAAIATWWVRKQLQKPVPDYVAPRLAPWEEALLELERLKQAALQDARPEGLEQRSELYDRVSDTVRKYLGLRYGFEGLGFDGLETTTGEMMTLLKRVRPGVPGLDGVNVFLSECDLVKFAKVVPEIEECERALDRAEAIVRATIPLTLPSAPSGPRPPAGATPPPPPAAPDAPPAAAPPDSPPPESPPDPPPAPPAPPPPADRELSP